MSISLDVSKTISFKPVLSEKSRAAAGLFGLSIERLGQRAVTHKCRIEIEDGDIVYITGPSGSGKSVLLAELQKAVRPSERINLSGIELPGDRAVLDCIDGDFLTSHR
jgi:ABC-type glutathione transport system ATPase component